MKQFNNTITVSAPGKLMLFGEHAVVYGKPCIVTAVNQRMKATVELIDDPLFQLNAPDVQISNYQKPITNLGKGGIPKGAKFVEIAVRNFFNCHPRPEKVQWTFECVDRGSINNNRLLDSRLRGNDSWGVKVTTTSQFNALFGFGSSSASTVCVIKALSELFGKKLSNKQIFDLSYKTVLDVQGKGSGFDVAAATYGGTLYFLTGGKVIEPLKMDSLPLIIGYSGIKADTITIVNEVLARAEKYPKEIENIYTSIQSIVHSAKKNLLKSDWESLGELMNFNEGYLSALGVSSQKLDSMISAARDAGAYGAKLSGAGIGDCMIALAPPFKVKTIQNAIEQAGGQIIEIETNAEGVRIEK